MKRHTVTKYFDTMEEALEWVTKVDLLENEEINISKLVGGVVVELLTYRHIID